MGTYYGRVSLVHNTDSGNFLHAYFSILDASTGVEITNYEDMVAGGAYTAELWWRYEPGLGTGFGRPNTLRIETRIPGLGAALGTTRTVTLSANGEGSQTWAFHMDDNPLGSTLGSARCGALELYVYVERTDVGTYNYNSRGEGSLPLATTATVKEGLARAKVNVLSATLSNVDYDGAEPTLWAYPDDIYFRATYEHPTYRATSPRFAIHEGTTQKIAIYGASQNDATREVPLAGSNGIDATFTAGLHNVVYTGSTYTHILYEEELGTVPTGWTQDAATYKMTYANRMDIDPATSVQNLTVDQGIGAVINRGEVFSGTLQVANARNEFFTPRGADQVYIINSADDAIEFSITVSRAAGVLTWSHTYPTTTTSGTAAATAAGSLKKLMWADGGTTQERYAYSTNIGAVSSLYNLSIHLQNKTGLDPALSTNRRLTTDLGFHSVKVTNQRGTAINGVTLTYHFRDDEDLAELVTRASVVTGNQNGHDGYTPLYGWRDPLPGGWWDLWVDAGSYNGNTFEKPRKGLGDGDFTLLALNANYTVVAGAGHPAAANQSEHWHPGDDLLIGAAMYNRETLGLQAVDTATGFAPTVVIGRFNTTYGVAQYLASDYTWQTLTGAAQSYRHPLTASAGDPNVWVTQLPGSVTSSWSHATLFFIAVMHVASTPYTGTAALDAPGAASPHGRSYQVMAAGGPTNKPDHWYPGKPFQAGISVLNMETGGLVSVDGYKQVAIFRLQDAGLNQGRGEYLAADGTWKPITNTEQVYFWDCAETRPDSKVYIKVWGDTSGWGDGAYDIFVMGRVKVGFFEYRGYDKEIGVGKSNAHSGYAVDPIGFALNGVIGTR